MGALVRRELDLSKRRRRIFDRHLTSIWIPNLASIYQSLVNDDFLFPSPVSSTLRRCSVKGDVLDFRWLEALPTSTLALGCTGRYLVGRSLKQVLAEYGVRPSIMAACRSAFLGQCSRVEHVEGKDGMALHQISPSRWELSIKVTNQAAVERVLSAQRVLSQLESRDQ